MREYANTAGMSSDLRNESAGCNGLICAAVIVVWMGGIRVVAIQPIGAIPEGVTAVVSGVRKIRLVDSPDAICAREHGGVSLICRGATEGQNPISAALWRHAIQDDRRSLATGLGFRSVDSFSALLQWRLLAERLAAVHGRGSVRLRPPP